jgi:two-component system alkaline phosphatase synthesis response regulator PhoP
MQNPAPRILLCDDEIHITRAAHMKLSRAGFDVEMASDGQAGWEAIQRQMPSLLVTDFQMPRLDGLELCRRLREYPPTRELPVILLTAKGYEYDWDQISRELSLTKVIAKPFSPRELLQTVQETLGLVGHSV